MRQVTKDQVFIHDNWIYVEGIGKIGLYHTDKKAIGLDYSLKWIVGSNSEIPCAYDQIKDKIVELFNL
jgi:hypothetical protein